MFINERASGVLCHISSLPSVYGIGDLGHEAYRFINILAQAKQQYWQVLPLNLTDQALGNSPYSSCSAFALNILFISPEVLVEDGFLTQEDLNVFRKEPVGKVDYEYALYVKKSLLSKAWNQYQRSFHLKQDFEEFSCEAAYWLNDFSRFLVLKEKFNQELWTNWPIEFRDREKVSLEAFDQEFLLKINEIKFYQFLLFRQWKKLQQYACLKGVRFIGDIPIYVNYDSVDAWVHPDIFKLDLNKKPYVVAGVPPDYFSKDGQRWGNPVYHWENLKKMNFVWWVDRVRHNLKMFDLVRIDHFRAFAQCWEIPADEKTAVNGRWVDVPGVELFDTFKKHFPSMPIIAEDLGIITPDVDALKDQFGLPGMRVLMFAFHHEYQKSRDLPENYIERSVVYTGTHDNNTILGWFEKDRSEIEKKNMLEYFGKELTDEDVVWMMIEKAMMSVSCLAIIPLQDVLELNQEARMNTPSTILNNWGWRFSFKDFSRKRINQLKNITKRSSRARKYEKK